LKKIPEILKQNLENVIKTAQ